MDIFGFEIRKKEAKKEAEAAPKSFVVPNDADGSTVIAPSNAYYGHYVDLEGDKASSDREFIKKYRAVALNADCESAINDIVNETIVFDDSDSAVTINLDKTKLSDNVKETVSAEFNELISLLNFSYYGSEYFRRWYVDGRIYFHLMVDPKKPKEGIQEIRYIDPLKIRKVREVETVKDEATGGDIVNVVDEYYIFSESDGQSGSNTGLKISKDAVAYVTSGYTDDSRQRVISHLHKAIKPMNQLRMLEDSLVIYRLARAPERRIFYIDVGNLPKGKAEEYLRSVMAKYRNKIVYDAATGEVKDERKHMSMLEDFWLPRREGGKGTEISTLPGGENLGQIDDVIFFQRRLYKALNVPVSRLESETGFTLGRASEISRDELKFQKLIDQLRKRFSMLFIEMLRVQLLTKNLITKNDWLEIKERIVITYARDNHFTELKNSEIITERLRLMADVDSYVGNYFSKRWVQKNILMLDEDEIAAMKKEIEDEKASGEIPDDEDLEDI